MSNPTEQTLSAESKDPSKGPSLAEQRKELAFNLLRLGTASLRAAQSHPAEAPQALKEACEYLLESIRYNRSNPDAFAAMGYLLWLIGENRDAAAFLEEALLLDPEHRDSLKIQALLPPPPPPPPDNILSPLLPLESDVSTAEKAPPAAPIPPTPSQAPPLPTGLGAGSGGGLSPLAQADTPASVAEADGSEPSAEEEDSTRAEITGDSDSPAFSPVSRRPDATRASNRPKFTFKSKPPAFAAAGPKLAPVIDYDRLYDQLESRIQREVKKLSIFHPDWYASSRDRFKVEKVEKQYISLRDSQNQFLQQIAEIEAEIDCSALHLMLKPLDIIVARCEHSLNLSWQMIQLQEMLDGHHRWMERELQKFEQSGHLPTDFSEERFDYLLKDCDDLADQLDQLEHLGLDCSRLVTAYERLAVKVSRFQDLRNLPAQG